VEKNAIAIRPGVFFVFQSEDDEQEFLEKRQRRVVDWTYQTRKPKRQPPADGYDSRIRRTRKIEENTDLIDRFWQTCLSLGRLCHGDEFDSFEMIRKIFGSGPKAFQYLKEKSEPDILEKAVLARKEGILVYLALGLFSKRKAYSHHPKSLQRDIKYLLGGWPTALEQARTLLFSVRDSALIEGACVSAAQSKFGFLLDGHSLQLHSSMISRLSPILRVYVGCATQLFGDTEKADLVKIHIQSKKISLMQYEDFWGNPLPRLKTRIKINLLEQKIDFFDYNEKVQPQILYLKSRYLHPSSPGYEAHRAFDEHLQGLNLFDFTGFGPPAAWFFAQLQKKGVTINGQTDY